MASTSVSKPVNKKQFMSTQTIAPFRFKQFEIAQDQCAMKVGTDGVLLGAWADVTNAKYILDIGTGTGVIAIMLGQRNQKAQIHAVEIDESACDQAQENMKNAPWNERLTAFPLPIQDFVKETSNQYDHIVSNPPFFTGGTFSGNQDRDSVRHTIKLPHSDLLRAVQSLLSPDGKFSVILPFIEGLRFEELAKTYHLYCNRKTEVIPKEGKSVERLLLEFQSEPSDLSTDQLIIQKEGRNDWTDEYIQLTKDFYLNM